MARGPKKHLKRLNAPRAWMLNKLGGTWAPRPSQGPHRLRESLPLSLILRNRLKYALTRREVMIITARRLIRVDTKVRTDLNYPTGFMDVISIDKTNEFFRVLYDVKGRFVLHRIKAEDASHKYVRVKSVSYGSKASVGKNPFKTGKEAAIPFLVTHDGRTIRYPDPIIKANDTLKIDLTTGKILQHLPFAVGNLCMITRGANIGRVGVIVHVDHHPGSFDIVHLRDSRDGKFATRIANVFVIGIGGKTELSLPRGDGIKYTVLEERENRTKQKAKSHSHKGEKRQKRSEKPKEEPKKQEKKPEKKAEAKKEAKKEEKKGGDKPKAADKPKEKAAEKSKPAEKPAEKPAKGGDKGKGDKGKKK